MGFSDFFNNSQEPKNLDLNDVFFESAKCFIKNNKRNITQEYKDGNTYLVFSEQTVMQFLQYLNREVSKAANAFIKQNYSSSVKDPVKNTDLMKTLGQVDDAVKRIGSNVLSGITYEKGRDKVYILPLMKQKQEDTLNKINLVLSELQNIISKQEASIQEQSKIIENQHNSILRYENDVLFRSKKELLMELIGIADQIKYTLDDQISCKDYDVLLDAVRSLGDWVNGSLQTETVRKYEKSKLDNSTFDAKAQEVIDVEETDNIEEDGKYKTILPGYYWTMPMVGSSAMQNIQAGPRSFEFVLRPEQVVKMKYAGNKNLSKYTDKDNKTDFANESAGDNTFDTVPRAVEESKDGYVDQLLKPSKSISTSNEGSNKEADDSHTKVNFKSEKNSVSRSGR